ncbi:MAG: 30S ribosomal protein S4 [Ignisphaera sp.]|uniref:Small ribosomal subunit protein uS4 n=1 Tax=Ignisphaera aggregans TaxID=334771 RepID=A0A7J3MZ93_9CREN
MGDPKKPRKKWESSGHPWIKARLEQELELVNRYGLRNKKELWIAQTFLRKIRHRARELLALSPDERGKALGSLAKRLYNMGIIDNTNIDINDILALGVESILERRLQTIVWKKGFAKTIYQARQLIVHGHIAIKGRRITSPGYIVPREEEENLHLHPTSPYAQKSSLTT